MKYVISATAILLVNAGVFALPQGGRIEKGLGNLDNPAHIIQESQHLQTRWNSFDIGAQERVRIQQPNAQASINIKVRNGAATNINGTLTANGRVSLENPAGIQFGANSVVNVGGLLASSANGAVTSLGQVSAAEVVRFQGLSGKSIVNVGGDVSAQEIIVESNGNIVIGNSAHFTASKQVLIGGGYQGKDSNVLNARTTDVKASAQINAPRVIVWSDKETSFLGRINAGKGFVEVSGKQRLIFPDISRVIAGTLLLDPANITIVAGSGANDSEFADSIINADDSASSTFTLGSYTINNYGATLYLRATDTITVNADITRIGGLFFEANNFVINAGITVSGGQLSFELTGVSPSAPFVFGSGGGITADLLTLAINYTNNYQFTPDASFTAHLAAPGRSVTIEVPNGDVSLNNGLNLCQVDTFPACGNLTITSRALSLTGTFFADGVDLTVTAGAIDFSSTPTITALTIALTQVDAFPAAAPADFGPIVPTLSASVGFSKLSWGNCGRNCFDPATDLIITDGNLTTALTSKGIAASGQVNLGSLSLVSSGMALDVPAGIKSITTTGTISITGGLTASAGLTLDANTITFGGAFNFGTNALTLNFATSLGSGATAPTLTAGRIITRHTGTGPVALPEWLFTGQEVELVVAEISIPTAATWDTRVLGFQVDTTITGEALTLTTTAAFISAIGFDLTINVASLSVGSNVLLLVDNLNVTSRAAGADNDFNLALTALQRLTVAGHISAGTGDVVLTAESGKITFTSNPTLTGGTITLKQAVAYDPIKPANFSTPPSLGSDNSFNKPAAWGVCGTSCLPSLAPLAPADLAITDGVLDTALTGKFAVVGGTLDLGAFDLTASGASLTIPSHITTITTTGTISITGGLTASAALTLDANTLTLSGAFNAGTNVLTLSFGTSIVGGATAPTLTVGGVTARYTGTGALTLPSWLFGAHDVALDIAEINIPTATTWTFDGLSFPSDTTITGASLTLTSTGAISAGDYLIGAGDYLTIDVASLSFGSAITLVGQNINITSSAAGTSNAFDLSMTARQSLTVAGHINAGTGALELTSNNGSVIFTSNPTITGATITLTQTAAYAATAPANFSTPPILNSSTRFTALSWGVCGDNCLVPTSADLVITDGNLTEALALLVSKFVVSGGTLYLGSSNLTSSGVSLDIPSTITAIITTGTISITSGLTASKALTLTADIFHLSGAINVGTNDLNLTFATSLELRATATAPTLTANEVTVKYTGTGPPTLPNWLFGAHGIALDIAEIDIPTPTTWTFLALSFPSDTTITGAALTLTSTGAFPFISAGDLTIDVASLSFGSAMTLLGQNININSRAAGATNAFALTVGATGNLTLEGNLNAGTGALELTSNNGSVIFASNPTITGATITLEQSAAFVNNSPATFSIKPVASRTGLATYSVPDWTACPSGDSNCSVMANIPTTSGGAADITLTSVISGKFIISGNTLDLLGADLVLETTANIILPAGLTTITTSGSGIITLVAASIITTGTTTIGTALTINANTLTIGGTWNLGTRALTLTAGSGAIVFNSGTNITAGSIALTQMAAYAASAPATFSTAPTLAAPSDFNKPTAWGVCGTNCFAPENLTIAGGNLGTALTGKFDVSSDGTLDLGAFNLTASGSSLTIPSTILSITTTGTISITGGLTATAALNLNAGGALTIGGTWNLGNRALALTTGAGTITFSSNPTITASSIELTQVSAFSRTAPAVNFGSVTPSIVSTSRGVSWATGGTVTAGNIANTGGSANISLADEIAGYFVISGTTLDLGSHNLTVSGGSLTVPSTITTITTTGTISIAGGLTASAALNLSAGTMALGGTFTAGSNALTLTSANAITASSALTISSALTMAAASLGSTGSTLSLAGVTSSTALTLLGSSVLLQSGVNVGANDLTLSFATSLSSGTAPTLTAGNITARHTGSGAITLPNWLLDGQSVILHVAEIDISTATTWSVRALRFGGDTTITGEALTLTTSAVSISASANTLIIDVASFSIGSNLALLGSSISINSRAAGSTNGFNLTLIGANSLTLEGHVNAGTGALALFATNGKIAFTSNPTITGASITLTQVMPYDLAVPATFSIKPVASRTGLATYSVPNWAACPSGVTTCTVLLAGGNLDITDGDLEGALVGKFVISGTTLDLGIYNLTASGTTLDIPSTITTITTTGTISITGGLTASAALSLSAGTMALGGTFTAGSNTLTLTSANAITAGSALTISSALVVAAPSLGSAGADLTLTGNVSSSGSSALALVGANITLGVGTFTTGTLTLTSANAITASSDLTISSALIVAAPSLGSTGFSLNLQGVTSSSVLALVGSTITLNDAVNVGGNALTITAAAGAIGFSNNPTITATSIALTQVDVFPRTAPADFGGVTPAIVRSGGTEQRAVPWATGGMTIAGDLSFIAAGDVNLEEFIIGYFAIDGNGILDLGAFDLTLATSGKVIFPAHLVEIRTTGDIQLNATNGIEGFGSQFALVASDLFLSGGLDFGATALSLRATTTLDLLGTAAATISADSIEFDVASIANGEALTLTARTGSLMLSGDINLGTAFTDLLNLNFATTLEQGATAPTITSFLITVRHTGSGAITLPEWLFTGQDVVLGVPEITLSADTTWAVGFLGFSGNTTITGTAHALTLSSTASLPLIMSSDELTIDVASLSFGSDMTISTIGELSVTSRAAGADNAFNLSLSASSNLTVAGHINAGTGDLTLQSGGKINFTNNPTITGATITLEQNATYDHDEPATFSVTPVASRLGLATGTVYAITTWADCPAGDALCVAPENIALIDQTADIILTDVIASKFAISGNTLDLLGSSLELSTTANIILPAGLTTITTSGNVTLVGASIITAGGGTQIGAALTVEANALTLGGAINAGTNNLTFTTSGGSLRFATATTINGDAIALTGGSIPDTSPPANVALVVTSSSTLALAGFVNVGTGSIVLTAGAGAINFSHHSIVNGNLTADAITLTQVDAYPNSNSGTFSVPPALNRSGSDNFNTPSWGVCGVDAECFTSESIDFTATGDAALVDILGKAFFIDGAGVLNLVSSSLSINIGGTLTLPAGLNKIVTAGGNITLIANTFTSVGALTIETTTSGDITFQGSYIAGRNVLFTLTAAGALNFGTGAETSLSGGLITLASGAAATASGQKLTIAANLVISFGGGVDINVAELVLETTGGFSGTPIITADDLTYTYSGGNSSTSTFAGSDWLFAAGRNVTLRTTNSGAIITLFAANATDTIDLCAADGTCGNLTLESVAGIQLVGSTQTSASLGTISANNISLKAGTRIGSDSTDINRNLTINAAGDLTIDTPSLALRNTLGAALIFNVAGSTTFTQDITVDAETMSGLGGTITAQALTLATAASATGSITFDAARPTDITTTGALSIDAVTISELGGTIIADSLTLATGSSATGSIAFSTTRDTNITITGAISMDAASISGRLGGTITATTLTLSSGGSTTGSLGFSTTRPTTITTTGDLTLEFETATSTPSGQNLTLTATGGDITLGTLHIGSGTLEVTTDQNIAFTSNPTITALEIYLTWEGTTDFGATAPATFTDGSTAPPLPYIEAANQTAGTWFQLAGFSIDAGAADIDFSAPVTLNRGADTLVVSVTAAGVLDFGANVVRLTTTGNIIFPASVREILASDLTINATTTGSGATAAPFANPLSITTTEDLELNTTLAMTAGTALNLTFAGTLEGALTLTATNLGITSTATTGATTLPSWVFGDAARALRLSVANITFSSDETWVAASITFAADTSITSTDQLLLNTPTLNAGANSLTINVARLNFFGTSASTITGGAVSFTASTVSGGGSGQALTITATTGNLTLAGELSIGAGAMTLTATQGVISFTSTPILTAASFLLTQGGAAFAAIKPADFQNAAGTDVRPTISYTAGVQLPVDWDVLTVFEMLTETAGGGFDLNILTSTGGGLVGFETSPGVLDFGNLDVILGTDNNITIPDRITEIRGRNIIIRAETFGRGTTAVADPLNGNIQFVATENIIFRADVQSDSRITFTGRSITFNNTKATQISGSEILITTTNPGLANNQNVTLNATGDITLDANLNLGVGTLVVNATGAIVTTDATTITAYTIFYHAATIRNGSNDVTLTAYDNIYLRGTNLSNRDAAVSLTAGGSIVTRGAFDITGSAVHFEQGQARYQAGRLTLHALTGGLTIVGPIAREMLTLTVSSPAQLDRSNAVIEGAVTIVVSP